MGLWPSMLHTSRSFEGGLYLPDHKALTARLPIQTLSADGPLHIPLEAARGLKTTPVVSAGNAVIGGETIARAVVPAAVDICAPTSGRIVSFQPVWTPEDGFLPGVILAPDGRDAALPPDREWAEESFVNQLVCSGVMCATPRMALHELLRRAIAADARILIVNGMETEPYLASELRTLVETPDRIVETACEIADAIGAARVLMAVPDRLRRVRRRLAAMIAGRRMELVALGGKYPQCHPVVLAKTLLDLETPPGESPLDVGVLVLPVSALRAAARPLLDGRPSTHAVLTVAGDAIRLPGVYRVPIGMPLRILLNRVEPRCPVVYSVSGGPLTGIAVNRDDGVVVSTSTALLAFSTIRRADPLPCVHCGWCVDDCPVGLDPANLMQLEFEPKCDRLELTHLQACIDCGLCSHVCPSHLSLAANIRRGRARWSPHEADSAAVPEAS